MKNTTKLLIGLYILSAVLFMLFYCSVGFSDFYMQYIFRGISPWISRFSNLFPFSLSEWTLLFLAAFIILGLLFSLVWMLVKKKKRFRALVVYSKIVLWWVGVILFLCVSHWLGMYHATTMRDTYLTQMEHTPEEWLELYDFCTRKMEQLEEKIERDENGYFVLHADMEEEPQKAMQNLSREFPVLSGYYPQAKKLFSSFFMSQSGTIGIYLPIFIEANYNADIVGAQVPATICHELSHLKGVIQEDEANFFGMMACINSSNTDLQYSGYLNILEYLLNNQPTVVDQKFPEQVKQCKERLSGGFWKDYCRYYPENYWEEHEDLVIIPTDIVNTVQNEIYDATLQLNGVEEGIARYDMVTLCLMDYFAKNHTLLMED